MGGMESRIFYVYVMFRPWDGSPFYVGKGKGNRWLQHEWRTKRHYNRRMAQIIERAKNSGLEIPKVKVRQHLTELEAFAIETAFIRAIGRGRNGPLVNFTDGGEGATGRPISDKFRAAISQLHTGRKLTDEHKAKLRSAALKRKQSDETKLKISKSLVGNKRCTGRKVSEQTRLKMSAAAMGNTNGFGRG